MKSAQLTEEQRQALRQLPAVESLLSHSSLQSYVSQYAHEYLVAEIRTTLDATRRLILAGKRPNLSLEALAAQVRERLRQRFQPRLRRVINLTGTITHTNLGRALLSKEACEHLTEIASHYSNLEFDLESGRRGHRDRITEAFLRELTGCEASTVVNNNAAAVLLVLNTLAQGREVIVSRGELIEIGGAFRIPEVMASSGAILREVGTTNRTYARDYEAAIHENTALLLKVHPSNYRIEGFSCTPAIEEIVALGRKYGIPTMEDLGSGALVDLRQFGLPYEPVVKSRIEAGVDIVTFSGDKLLGGPQAGIIVGKKALIERIRRNPLMRALRVGKLTLSALEATLRCYLRPLQDLPRHLPMLGFYVRDIEQIQRTARNLAEKLREIFGSTVKVTVEETRAQIGSGSLPVELLPSAAVALTPQRVSVEQLASWFREWRVPIVGRIQDDKLFFDLRSATPQDLDEIPPAAAWVFQRMDEAACAT